MIIIRYASLILFSILFSNIISAQDYENRIIGEWYTSNKDAVITMYYDPSSGKKQIVNGKISWMDEPNENDGSPKMDNENPKENLRSRTILGLEIIKDLEWSGDEDEYEWDEGTAYDPESGNTYSFKAYMDPEDPNTLNCRGYIGLSLIGRTETWTRKLK